MIERVLLLGLIGLAVVVTTLLVRRYARAWRHEVMRRKPDLIWKRLGEAPDGRPTVIAFSTPSCAACHRAQAPAINNVVRTLGERAPRVIKVDASERPEVARAFGVMTVPSTVVLAEAGSVIAINHGFAASGTLLEQLHGA
jgi:thiol-disulfide isomerase/thioredoxin